MILVWVEEKASDAYARRRLRWVTTNKISLQQEENTKTQMASVQMCKMKLLRC